MVVLLLWKPEERLESHLRDRIREISPRIRLRLPPNGESAREALLRLAPGAQVMVGWRPDPELLAAAVRLKLFINPGAGVQHLLPMFDEPLRERGVVLVNGHGNAGFTAQHALALLLSLTNRIPQHHGWMSEGRWRTGDAEAASIPLTGRRIGLLGYGRVNRRVHRLLTGFDLQVAALRTAWPDRAQDVAGGGLHDTEPHDAGFRRFTPDGLNSFLEWSDAVIVSVPLTSETRGLIGAGELRLLGEEGLLVNVSRGPVVDRGALYEALRIGAIAGAALDVWYDYDPAPDESGRRFPYAPDTPFHELSNVVLSPHRGASPFSDLGRWDDVIENIRRAFDGRGNYLNVVDLDRGY
ncbi:hypothetical protein JW921_02985 [Candidatus Fermentibacterales bacterium]|nr:hypothetical protein [Candidatus Fermentibacterales bacterium]